MKLVRCENGHFYDSEQYTVCPYCSGMDSVGADNVTQPISQKKPDDDIPTQKESNAGYTPTQSISGNGIQQKLKTVTHQRTVWILNTLPMKRPNHIQD